MATTTVRKVSELLIVTKNEIGAAARITSFLTRNNINMECFTGYEWGGEMAFRFVTSNNKKARDALVGAGYNVQESNVVLWNTTNTPGTFTNASTSLAEADVNTYCTYSTAIPNSTTTTVIFNTSNPDRTMDVLQHIS